MLICRTLRNNQLQKLKLQSNQNDLIIEITIVTVDYTTCNKDVVIEYKMIM